MTGIRILVFSSREDRAGNVNGTEVDVATTLEDFDRLVGTYAEQFFLAYVDVSTGERLSYDRVVRRFGRLNPGTRFSESGEEY